jgi:hypothetical protein
MKNQTYNPTSIGFVETYRSDMSQGFFFAQILPVISLVIILP